MKAEDIRKKLMREGMSRSALDKSPYVTFEKWYQQTIDSDIPEPTAMSIATVDTEGQPWQRMVLLKLFDENGFIFFTNYNSRKAGHIENNNKVSLLFPWHALGRQVKIAGSARKIGAAESLKYFITRPRGSRIGAWASPQSEVITARSVLDAKVEEMKQKFSEGDIPLPSFWGGYRVVPSSIEFWQARDNRLHDRFIYRRVDSNNWTIDRLAP